MALPESMTQLVAVYIDALEAKCAALAPPTYEIRCWPIPRNLPADLEPGWEPFAVIRSDVWCRRVIQAPQGGAVAERT